MVEESVELRISAKTVSHHHAQLVRLARKHAEPLSSRNTMSATIMDSQEKQK